jgi:hypothetical protein
MADRSYLLYPSETGSTSLNDVKSQAEAKIGTRKFDLLEIIHPLLSFYSCPHWQRFNLIYAAHTRCPMWKAIKCCSICTNQDLENHLLRATKSLVSQSLCMDAALLIFCRSWAASISVFSMRSPPAHIWTYYMQLVVREKKNVCKSTSPGNPSLGPCWTSSLNLFHAWFIPSSSPCLKLITCVLICWILLIWKNLAQNFFINWSQFPSTSKDANEYHFIASSASE